MVAVINTGTNTKGALEYNENKIAQGTAEFLVGGNILKDASKMGLNEKNAILQKYASLNEWAKTNCYHISISFHKNDKLSKELLQDISKEYLDKIGFGNQPYFLYQHKDTEHPHVHIVTTNIDQSGKRINDSYIGSKLSEPANRELEKKYSLTVAPEQNNQILIKDLKQLQSLKEKRHYTRNSILYALKEFKFSSIDEFKASLKLFGIKTELIEKKFEDKLQKGLVFSLINDNGSQVSPNIKSSKLFEKNLLKQLESKFSKNQQVLEKNKDVLKKRLEYQYKRSNSLEDFTRNLNEVNIKFLPFHDRNGLLRGTHFLDLSNGCIYKGSSIGKQYSANSLREFNQSISEGNNTQQFYKDLQKEFNKQIRDSGGMKSVAFKSLNEDTIQSVQTELPTNSKHHHTKNFIEFHRKNYERYLQEDSTIFKEVAEKLQYFKTNPEILKAFDIIISDKFLTHKKNNELQYINHGISDNTRDISLTAKEKAFLLLISSHDVNEIAKKNYSLRNLDYSKLSNYITASDKKTIEPVLNKNHIGSIISNLSTGSTISKLTETLYKNGVLIKEGSNGDLLIGHYSTENYLMIDPSIKKQIVTGLDLKGISLLNAYIKENLDVYKEFTQNKYNIEYVNIVGGVINEKIKNSLLLHDKNELNNFSISEKLKISLKPEHDVQNKLLIDELSAGNDIQRNKKRKIKFRLS